LKKRNPEKTSATQIKAAAKEMESNGKANNKIGKA